MSFTSLQFIFFFPIVTAIYFALPHRRRWLHLLAASCVFYMAFVPAYILILAFTIVIDYFAGIAIARAEGARRRQFLIVSLVANLSVLAVFKYYDFVVFNLNDLLAVAHVRSSIPLLAMVLPIGLSFHTFQAMSYTIEVYRGNQEPERHFGIYALYVMFYPQLVAGPIERPQNLLHQFREPHRFDYDKVTSGLRQMAWGFFKKTVVADRLAVGADTVYANPHHFSGVQLVLGTLMFVIQVYADFSGYSDIALGAARVMGFDLMMNFNRPYGARNLAEFWRRWHISLYSWLNDYVYTTFVIAHRDWGKLAVLLGVALTMTLSGLWHGAAWTFVVFGAIHAAGLLVEMFTRRWRKKIMRARAWGYAGIATTFSFVCFADIFFRSRSIADAFYVVSHLGSGLGDFMKQVARPGVLSETLGAMGFFREELVVGALAATAMFALESLNARYDLLGGLRKGPRFVRWSAYYAVVVAIVFFGAHNAIQPFIYFQF